jgi:hypothetical protein
MLITASVRSSSMSVTAERRDGDDEVFRGAAREPGQGDIGDAVTILVPEGQLQAAQRILGAMPAENDPS